MDELGDLMTLLAISVMADDRVMDSEISVFAKAVSRISLSNVDMDLPSEAEAMTWFQTFGADIRSIVAGPRDDFERRLVDLLDRIKSHVKPEALIHTLEMISAADGEIHHSETGIIDLIKRHWGLT